MIFPHFPNYFLVSHNWFRFGFEIQTQTPKIKYHNELTFLNLSNIWNWKSTKLSTNQNPIWKKQQTCKLKPIDHKLLNKNRKSKVPKKKKNTFSSQARQRAASSAAQKKIAAAPSQTSQRVLIFLYFTCNQLTSLFLCMFLILQKISFEWKIHGFSIMGNSIKSMEITKNESLRRRKKKRGGFFLL